jgi:hypothetical protein
LYIWDGDAHDKWTRVIVVDAAGTRYYWKTKIGNTTDWTKTGNVIAGSSVTHYINGQESNGLVAQIAEKDAILMGGSLEGWQ